MKISHRAPYDTFIVLTYMCVVQVPSHINTENSGYVFDVLQDGLDQRQKSSPVISYAEMIDQRLFHFCVTPNENVRCPMETVQQRVQVTWAQRKIPHDQFYDLAKSGMHNPELLARFLCLCFVAEEHLEWPDLVLVVLQSGYAQRYDGQRDADYLNTSQRHARAL